MSTTMFLAMCGIMSLGLLMVWFGWRGKRINRVPACRQCGFDVSGVIPAGVTCPECGAGLMRKAAVRTGQRRRRWIVTGAGAVAVAMPAVTLMLTFFAIMTGRDVNDYKPVGVLLWEARNADAATSAGAAAELLDRFTIGQLSVDQLAEITRVGLDVQEDPGRPWTDDWGDFLAQRRFSGDMSEEQEERFERNAPVFEAETRPSVRVAGELPIVLTVKESRLGPNDMAMCPVQFDSARVDGREVSVRSLASGPFMTGRGMGVMQLVGSGARWGGMSGGTSGCLLDVPLDLGPGRHTVSFEVRSKTTLMNPSGGWSYTWPNSLGDDCRSDSFALTFEVLPPGDDDLELVDPTPELDAQLLTDVLPQMLQAHRMGLQTYAYAMFSVGKPPVDLACDVIIRHGGTEQLLGTLTTGTTGSQDAQFGFGSEQSIAVNGEVRPFEQSRVDLILRPNEELARRTIDLARIYAGELVFENVEVMHEEQDVGSGMMLFQALGSIFGGGGNVAGGGGDTDAEKDDQAP